ncbi:MAG: DUF1566 domain-containing protein [Gemmatimonadetes bacterium]|nr:DUF1566 domain-containing protein [Gemmatimonadota bacterium]
MVALQTADPSCPDDSGNVYVDCGNGTVTDNRTGLVWLADADCLGAGVTWEEALAFVSGLSDVDGALCESAGFTSDAACDCDLSDGSSPGEWRLPSPNEWAVMVSDALACVPTLTDDSGTSCQTEGTSSFSSVGAKYVAAMRYPSSPNAVWGVSLLDGSVTGFANDSTLRVWPVRGGQ